MLRAITSRPVLGFTVAALLMLVALGRAAWPDPVSSESAPGRPAVSVLTPSPGPAGPQGPPGERGPAGRDGSDGVDGRDGLDGRNGVDGVAGAPGVRGPVGSSGPQGVRGARGPAGVAGADGARGPRGRPGVRGPQGPPGLVVCPEGFSLQQLTLHQRQPEDTDRTVYVCALD